MSKINLRDVFAPHLRPRAAKAVQEGALDIKRFKECFEIYPEVLVQIMRLSGLDQQTSFLGDDEQEYARGGMDLARDIYSLTLMKEEGSDND